MIPRPILSLLVFGLVLLLVAFSVLMAFYALISAMGDSAGATALLWAAIICLVMLVVDMILLLGALGLRSLRDEEE